MTNRPLEVLQEHFGFKNFRPGQEQVIDQVLAGQNTPGGNADRGWEVTLLPDTGPD